MGVYFKGMEIPDKCGHCRFATAFECQVTKNFITTFNVRQADCPLIPIPPHGRLIDADEISEHKYTTMPPYRREYCDGKPKSEDEVVAFKFGWNSAIDAITENAPTIIEAEAEP